MTLDEIPPRVAAAYSEGERAFAELSATLDADPDQPLHGEDGSEWTAKHVYVHMDRWQRWTVRALETSLKTGQPVEAYADEAEMEAINARWSREADALTHAHAREQCLESKGQMQRAFLALTDEQWQRWGTLYGAEFHGGHYRRHLEYIHSQGAASP